MLINIKQAPMSSMMERIKHALGGDLGEFDESDNHEASSNKLNSTRPQNEMNRVSHLSSHVGMNEALPVNLLPRMGSMDTGMDIRTRDPDLGYNESYPYLRGLMPGPHTRPGVIPDLFSLSPGASATTLNTSALTNTSPLQHSTDRATPSASSLGLLGLEDNMGRFTSKRLLHHHNSEKSSRKDVELDMNLPFPVKLHYILSNPKYQDCVAWLPHGRAWRVLKPKAFERRIIPKFFRSEKYASFMRQVRRTRKRFQKILAMHDRILIHSILLLLR